MNLRSDSRPIDYRSFAFRLLARRREAERFVETLLDAMNELDGDPDLEPDNDDEDSHDAEAVNEDGGDINDEPQNEVAL